MVGGVPNSSPEISAFESLSKNLEDEQMTATRPPGWKTSKGEEDSTGLADLGGSPIDESGTVSACDLLSFS
jgi:hypothetical protein